MKKVLKWAGVGIVLLLVVGTIAVITLSEDLPQGQSGPKAEALADEVLSSINDDAMDSLQWLTWSFIGGHDYIWHPPTNTARISWGKCVVIMDLDELTGRAWKDGEEVSNDKKAKLLKTAWSYWCNDSFWLLAPNKMKDPGTQRYVVDVSKDYPGQRGLLVQYDSGGVTPGDAYLWMIDENGMPTGYKMWVSIIPVKGVYTSWDNWISLHNGAKVATTHDGGIMEFGLSNIKSADTWEGLGLSSNPIKGL